MGNPSSKARREKGGASSPEQTDLDAVHAGTLLRSQFAKDRIAIAPKARRQQPRARNANRPPNDNQKVIEEQQQNPSSSISQDNASESKINNSCPDGTNKADELAKSSLTDDVFEEPSQETAGAVNENSKTPSSESIANTDMVQTSSVCKLESSNSREDRECSSQGEESSDEEKEESPYDNAPDMRLFSEAFKGSDATQEFDMFSSSLGIKTSTDNSKENQCSPSFESREENKMGDEREETPCSATSRSSSREESESTSSIDKSPVGSPCLQDKTVSPSGKFTPSNPLPGINPKSLDLNNLRLKKTTAKNTSSGSISENQAEQS